jgi:hypothetical protein
MMTDPRASTGQASVDFLVDENAARLDVPDGTTIRPADDREPGIGATGPTNWWRRGLIALGIVAAILLVLQLWGGTPGTDVQPGTPTAVQETPPVVPVQPAT